MLGDAVSLEFNGIDVDSWLALFTFTHVKNLRYHGIIMAGKQSKNCILLLSEISSNFRSLKDCPSHCIALITASSKQRALTQPLERCV